MSDPNNPHGVAKGQKWQSNDIRDYRTSVYQPPPFFVVHVNVETGRVGVSRTLDNFNKPRSIKLSNFGLKSKKGYTQLK